VDRLLGDTVDLRHSFDGDGDFWSLRVAYGLLNPLAVLKRELLTE
jgi:hypothetical protein